MHAARPGQKVLPEEFVLLKTNLKRSYANQGDWPGTRFSTQIAGAFELTMQVRFHPPAPPFIFIGHYPECDLGVLFLGDPLAMFLGALDGSVD